MSSETVHDVIVEPQFDFLEAFTEGTEPDASRWGVPDKIQAVEQGIRTAFEDNFLMDTELLDVTEISTIKSATIVEIFSRYAAMVSADMDRLASWTFECSYDVHPLFTKNLSSHKDLILLCLKLFFLVFLIATVFFITGILQRLWIRFMGWSADDESYKETAANLANSMRMLIDKQSKEMHILSSQKRRLEEHVAALQAELDRIIAAIENSNGEQSNLQLIADGANRLRLESGNSESMSGTRHLSSTPTRSLPSSLRRNRERVHSGHDTFNSPQSIASDSLASTIAANAALLSTRGSSHSKKQGRSEPELRGVRGVLQRLARAIPETDEHPVVGYMPSPSPRFGGTNKGGIKGHNQ